MGKHMQTCMDTCTATLMHVSIHKWICKDINAKMHRHGREQCGAPKLKTEKIIGTGGTMLFI